MPHRDGRLAREQPHAHQRHADPGQPVLARLPVGVEEGSDALRQNEKPVK